MPALLRFDLKEDLLQRPGLARQQAIDLLNDAELEFAGNVEQL